MKQETPTADVNAATTTLDPDVRFLLANERTLLAWVRTGLALTAGGLILTQLGTHAAAQTSLGIVAILLGAMMTLLGYMRYRAADRAIRAARLPDAGRGVAVQVIAVVAFAIAIAAMELLRTW